MNKLKYKFTNDLLFKSVFVKLPELLKMLVAAALGIPVKSISKFEITNADLYPDVVGEKYCKLDINMVVNGWRVNLEVQVRNQGDFHERSLFYWAKNYTSTLQKKEKYSTLPRTIVISIVDFPMFECKEYRSEFGVLELNRHERLTDKLSLVFIELRKLPKEMDITNELELILSLFRAKTAEDLEKIEALGVPFMTQAVRTYRETVADRRFRELARIREKASHDEAQALANAAESAKKAERKLWRAVVADKDAAIADKDAAIADKDVAIADMDAKLLAALVEKDAALAEKEAVLAEIAALRAKLDTQPPQ